MIDNHTICAISTPPGQGGIAVVRLSGAKSYTIANKVFIPFNKNKKVLQAEGYTALYGQFKDEVEIFDDGIALFFKNPHSYTGEDVIELSCHGGEAVSLRLLQACIKTGAYMAQPGEFTKRAMLNGKLDLAQAESVMEMISSTSEQGTALAKAGLAGAMAKAIYPIKQDILAVMAHISAFIDFPDEDVEEPDRADIEKQLYKINERLQDLLTAYQTGSLVRRGIQAAIVGSPNVGKSTIFNLLAGYDRAIVTSIAGTTRDVVQEHVQVGNVSLILADTAGMHETDDIVEAEGIKRSYEKVEQASFIIAVYDSSKPLNKELLQLAEHCKGKPSLCIVNKSDLKPAFSKNELEPFFSEVIYISALDEKVGKTIGEAINRILHITTVDPNMVVIANQRQFLAVQQANNAVIEAVDALNIGITLDAVGFLLQSSVESLNSITGENVSEEVIDEVFARFCVGK